MVSQKYNLYIILYAVFIIPKKRLKKFSNIAALDILSLIH